MDDDFSVALKKKMDVYVHLVFRITKSFPKEELYNTTSQLKRASLSVILNYIEGFARKKQAVKRNFWEISYGSLKESQYLLYFSFKEGFLNKDEYERIFKLGDEIGAMLWRSLESIKE